MNLASWVALWFCVAFLLGLGWWLWRDWVWTRHVPKTRLTRGRIGIQVEWPRGHDLVERGREDLGGFVLLVVFVAGLLAVLVAVGLR